jgi:hypothetical protein
VVLQLLLANFAVLPWREQQLPAMLLVLMLRQAAAQVPVLVEVEAFRP